MRGAQGTAGRATVSLGTNCSECEELKAQLAGQTAALGVLRTDCDDLKAQVLTRGEEMKAELAIQTAALGTKVTECEELNVEIGQLSLTHQEQVAAMREQLCELDWQWSSGEKEISSQGKQLDELEQLCITQKQEMTNLRTELATCEAQHTAKATQQTVALGIKGTDCEEQKAQLAGETATQRQPGCHC